MGACVKESARLGKKKYTYLLLEGGFCTNITCVKKIKV